MAFLKTIINILNLKICKLLCIGKLRKVPFQIAVYVDSGFKSFTEDLSLELGEILEHMRVGSLL